MKYKPGDRIIGIKDYGGKKIKGQMGTVRTVINASIGVEWDNDVKGHDGNGYFKCAIGHGYIVGEDCIDFLKPSKILITTDGTTTLARLYEGKKVIKSAKVKYNPADASTFPFAFTEGAGWAFEKLTGLTVEHRNKTENKPVEAKETVKLYCVKGVTPGRRLTKGQTYEADCDGYITYDNGDKSSCAYGSDQWKNAITSISSSLVPLVKRPAKVGEYICIVNKGYHGPELVLGDIHCVTKEIRKGCITTDKNNTFCGAEHNDYLVLDGYTPEPEKPEYYNGKVVCIGNIGVDTHWTVGKVYEFKDGYATTNNGIKSPSDSFDNSPITSFEQIEKRYCGGNKFIEYKE
ncbi:MAG: hypothetical protein VB078_00305 [Clostridiaceae bacterium]|nr:hypothetical protein [Clostridiaceae bacterium]